MADEKKNLGGRPREHDREDIGRALLEWAKKEDSFNLCGFCADNELDPTMVTKWAKDDSQFCKAYNIAKAFIGRRREEALKSNKLHVKAYDLNATTYDHFMKDERRQTAEYEASLKTQTESNIPQEIFDKFDSLMSRTSERQSARKIDDKSNKAE